MTRAELRKKIREGVRVLALEFEKREGKNFMLTPEGKLITDLVTLANSQTQTISGQGKTIDGQAKTINDQAAQIKALSTPTPEDADAIKAAQDLLAAQAAAKATA